MAILGVSIAWILLVTTIVLLLHWLWKNTTRPYTKYNIPPYPVKPWPFVGHFFIVLGNIRQKMKDWREKTGSIYSLDMVGQHHIVVNDFKDMKEIWVKRADYITNIQHSFGDELLEEYDTGLFAARDENWKEQRTTSIAILRSFGLGKNLMAERITQEAIFFIEKLAELKGRPENVQVLINISVSNVICSVAVGRRFEHEDPYFVRLVNLINTMLKYFFHMHVITPFKELCSIPGDMLHAHKWADANREVNETFAKVFVRKCKEEFRENEEPDNFIAAYLAEIKKKQDKGEKTGLSEKNLVTIIRNLFQAGTETSSTTILWCLIYMLYNPDVQEKVYKEIETHVGTARIPNISDKPKLTYLNAVIMEVQRLSSLVPIGFRREISATFEASGYTFPKGSVLWPALDSVLLDKKIWGDPENFRPERFIDEKGSLITKEELIPFGIGRRICLGEALAKMELFIFLAAMFQRFQFETEKSGELPSMDFEYGTTVVPVPFKVRFIERKH